MAPETRSTPRSKTIVDDLKRLPARIEVLKTADGHSDPLSVLDVEEYRWVGKLLQLRVLRKIAVPGSARRDVEVLEQMIAPLSRHVRVQASDSDFSARRLLVLQHAEALAIAQRFPEEDVDDCPEVAEALATSSMTQQSVHPQNLEHAASNAESELLSAPTGKSPSVLVRKGTAPQEGKPAPQLEETLRRDTKSSTDAVATNLGDILQRAKAVLRGKQPRILQGLWDAPQGKLTFDTLAEQYWKKPVADEAISRLLTRLEKQLSESGIDSLDLRISDSNREVELLKPKGHSEGQI